jgi:hypothetical protein
MNSTWKTLSDTLASRAVMARGEDGQEQQVQEEEDGDEQHPEDQLALTVTTVSTIRATKTVM